VKNQNTLNDDFLKNLAKEYVMEIGEIYKKENAAITPAPTPALDAKMKAARRRKNLTIGSGFAAQRKINKRFFVSIAASVVILVIGITFLPEIFNHTDSEAEHLYFTEDVAASQPVPDSDDAAFEQFPVAPMPPSMEMAAEAAEPEFWDSDYDEMDMVAPAPSLPMAGHVSLTPPPGWQILYVDFDGDMAIFHLEGEAQNLVVVTAATLPPAENDFSDFLPVLINDTWAYMRIESTHSVLIYQLDGVQFTLTTVYSYHYLMELARNWV